MNSWRGTTDDGRFSVEFWPSALETLDRYCASADSSETGGILVGRYSGDCSLAIVIEATPPPADSKRGHSWFVRGICGLRDLLAKRWRAKERSFYIGEWHFHPAAHVEPSADDFAQMLEISYNSNYECKEPILLILCKGHHDGYRHCRAFVCPRHGAPLELHRTS